jgi:AbrB family looped-hinge helix DNA binding protein
MELIEIKTATITEKGQIAIPKDIRALSGFETGTKIVILAFQNHIEIRPLNQVSNKIRTAIASEKSLAKEWNSKEEDEAWKNL